MSLNGRESSWKGLILSKIKIHGSSSYVVCNPWFIKGEPNFRTLLLSEQFRKRSTYLFGHLYESNLWMENITTLILRAGEIRFVKKGRRKCQSLHAIKIPEKVSRNLLLIRNRAEQSRANEKKPFVRGTASEYLDSVKLISQPKQDLTTAGDCFQQKVKNY